MATSDVDYKNLDYFLLELKNSAMWMRMFGWLILILTLLNLSFLIDASLARSSSPTYFKFASASSLFLIFCAVAFEQTRKKGFAIYAEVTDEIHRIFNSENSNAAIHINFRVSLKNFAGSMDLPLIPGRFGVAVYIILNFAIVGLLFTTIRRFD